VILTQVPAATGNFGVGRGGKQIKYIVMHWMAGRIAGADARFKKPGEQASAHYGIAGDIVHQYVAEKDTAYHAGNFAINQESIGIEHEGGPDIPITDATYATSAALVREICKRYNLPISRATLHPHKEYKATQCPGTLDIDRVINLAMGDNMDFKATIIAGKQNEYGITGNPTVRCIVRMPNEPFFTGDMQCRFDNVRWLPADWPEDPKDWAGQREYLRPAVTALEAQVKDLQDQINNPPPPTEDPDIKTLKLFVQLIRKWLKD